VSARKSQPAVETPRQYVPIPCECSEGKKGQYLEHYEIVRCNCGRVWWALQPDAGGPLVAHVWPGNYRTGPLKNGMFEGRKAA
jgi:hypothetical protein